MGCCVSQEVAHPNNKNGDAAIVNSTEENLETSRNQAGGGGGKKKVTKIIKKRKNSCAKDGGEEDSSAAATDNDQQQPESNTTKIPPSAATSGPTANAALTSQNPTKPPLSPKNPVPKTSPFDDQLLKNLPWTSLRQAIDAVLLPLLPTSISSTNSANEQFAVDTIQKFRRQSGLFFISGSNNNNNTDDAPSFWKGRGFISSGDSFVEESELFSAIEGHQRNGEIASFVANLRASLGFSENSREINQAMQKLAKALDIVVASLLLKDSIFCVSPSPSQEENNNNNNNNNNNPIDYTRGRNSQLSNAASNFIKNCFDKNVVRNNDLKFDFNNHHHNSSSSTSRSIPEVYPPQTPSLLEFASAPDLMKWNAVIQCVETVSVLTKLFRPLLDNSTCTSSSSSSLSSIIVQSIYRFTGDPSSGMCSVMRLEEILDDLKILLSALGFLPSTFLSSNNNNNTMMQSKNKNQNDESSNHTSWFHHLPVPLLSPHAVSVLLFCGCILYKQQRLTLKDIDRTKSVLDQLEEQLVQLASQGKNAKTYLYSTSFRLSPMFKNEAGEGHGPRKDFYSTCCNELLAITSEANHQFSNNDEGKIPNRKPLIKCFDHFGNSIWFNGGILDHGVVIEEEKENNSNRQGKKQPKVLITSLVPLSELSEQNWNNNNKVTDDDRESSRRYFAAGWLLGNAIVNGVPLVELGLPSIFFEILRKLTSSSSSSATVVPKDFTEEDLLEVNDQLSSAISVVRNKTKTLDDFIAYCEGCIIEDDDNEGKNNNNKDDSEITSFDDALSTSKRCSLKTTIRLLKEYFKNNNNNNNSNNSSSPRTSPATFIILRHIVYPFLYEDNRKRWAAVAAGFRASIVPLSCREPFFSLHLNKHQLQGACIGGAASQLDNISKNFSFADSFNIHFDKEFSKFRFYFAFKNVILEGLDLVSNGNNEKSGNADVDDTNSNESLIDFKRRMLQFITGRKLVPFVPSSDNSSSSSASNKETISIVLISSPTSGWTVRDVVSKLSKTIVTAHTCTNTLEIPNYYEAVVLEHLLSLSSNNDRNNNGFVITPSTAVDDRLRNQIWDVLDSEEDRMKVRIKVHGLFLKMMKIASYEGLTFELDEMESTGDRDRHFNLSENRGAAKYR